MPALPKRSQANTLKAMAGNRASKWVFGIGFLMLGAWTVAAAVCAVGLARAHGHPPGIAFVPFVGLAWLIGCGVLAFATIIIALVADDRE